MGRNTHKRHSIKLLAIISMNRHTFQTIPHSCLRCWRKRFRQLKEIIDHIFEHGARLPALVPRVGERGWTLVMYPHMFPSPRAKQPHAHLVWKKKKKTGLKQTGQAVWPQSLLVSCPPPNSWRLEQIGQPHMAHRGANTGVPAEGQLQLWQQMPRNELTPVKGVNETGKGFYTNA